MSYLKRYWWWSAAYIATWLWVWFFTDIRVSLLQALLLLAALNCYGVAQRNLGRWDQRRPAAPTRAAEFLPGDKVEMSIPPGVCEEYDGRHGIVTHGPDDDGGWIVNAAPGSIRCVASELTMLTPREAR